MEINNLAKKLYRIPNLSKSWLDKKNFRYNSYLSNCGETDFYTMRFPVISYSIYVTIEAEIVVNLKDNVALIDVFDRGTRSKYASWYQYEYGNYETIIDRINEKITEKINQLGLDCQCRR